MTGIMNKRISVTLKADTTARFLLFMTGSKEITNTDAITSVFNEAVNIVNRAKNDGTIPKESNSSELFMFLQLVKLHSGEISESELKERLLYDEIKKSDLIIVDKTIDMMLSEKEREIEVLEKRIRELKAVK